MIELNAILLKYTNKHIMALIATQSQSMVCHQHYP